MESQWLTSHMYVAAIFYPALNIPELLSNALIVLTIMKHLTICADFSPAVVISD